MVRPALTCFLVLALLLVGTTPALGDQTQEAATENLAVINQSLETPESPPATADSVTDPLPKCAPAPEVEVSRGSSTARSIITTSLRFLGVPYRYGGTSVRGFDCSGFVGHVFGLLNIKLPRSSREQALLGAHVDRDSLIPADLVFFKTGGSSRINHVGIYLGDNKFIHASSSKGITITSLSDKYYQKAYCGARRILGQ